MTPQCYMLLGYMQDHGSVTARQASRELDIDRCASRIHEMKRAGIEIDTEMVYTRKPDGTPEKFARYYLKG